MEILCHQCSAAFEITDLDLQFLDRLSPVIAGQKRPLPPPTHCPECRKRRRLSLRNERKLYHRKCDLTGKQLISIFSPEKNLTVYQQQEWWSDKWSPHAFAKEPDFTRPFFAQFAELYRAVPHMNVIGEAIENSDYCNLIAHLRNCYLVFESSNNEDCFYGYWLQKCSDCSDVSYSHECRFCHDVDNCYNCHQLLYSKNCTNCSDSAFLSDCIGCHHCLFSANLRQREYCIFNEQYTKEEYEQRLAGYSMSSFASLEAMKRQYADFMLTQPRRATQQVNTENCTGDYVQQSKSCFECYHAHEAEDCRYAEHVWRDSKNNMDGSTVGRGAELCYECINTGIGSQRDLFCMQCWSGTSDLLYCAECFSCQDCFGCVGLTKARYCIFNKQYSKEEYERLVPLLIGHMRKTNEWGEFFPTTISLFGYNESVAQEYFPISAQEAGKNGWNWQEEEVRADQYLGPPYTIPDTIDDVSDDITKQILICAETQKPYKVIPQELAFYRRLRVPVPRLCPDQRHAKRIGGRNPQHLWSRHCMKCDATIQTTYAPERPEIVYCDDCYLSAVY